MTNEALIEKSTAAGLRIIERSGHHWIGRTGRNAAEVRIYEDGTIMRSDVRLDLATRMTAAEAAKLLGI